MNIQYLKEITDVLAPFMKENGFAQDEEHLGVFKGEAKTYTLKYDEEKKLYSVSVNANDSETSTELSSWYFDESDHGAKDTVCIGEDFLAAVAKDAGVKTVKSVNGTVTDVAMPEKAALGEEPNIEAFTQKFLAMFPQYKESYKAMVSKYGSFLYVEFFRQYGIEKMRELMANEIANKKQLVKYWKMLGDMHYEGELAVAEIICSVILAGTFGNDPAAFDSAAEKYLADYPFLKAAGRASVADYKHNRKLRAVIEG